MQARLQNPFSSPAARGSLHSRVPARSASGQRPSQASSSAGADAFLNSGELAAADAPPEVDPRVAEAMAKAQAALEEADKLVEHVDKLPSARLPTVWDNIVRALKPLLQVSAVVGYCTIVHAFHAVSQCIGGLLLAIFVAGWGWRKRALSASGALAAGIVGWATLGASFRAGLVLLGFFFASSKITQLGDEDKAVDEAHKSGGQRDWVQVMCNGAVPAVLAIAAAVITGGYDLPLRPAADATLAALYAAFLGYFSCCCGDTWASELGQLSDAEPRLITTLRPVRKGTNGGVTLLGLAASIFGGLFVGLIFYAGGIISPTGNYAVAVQQWPLILLGVAAGLVGSIIDSVLGATVQFTGYNRETGKITSRSRDPAVTRISGFPLLDNNGVNVVSATLTAVLTGVAALHLL